MDLVLPVELKAPDGEPVGRIEMGAAEGAQYATLVLYKGDIINVRNIQGGTADNANLDLGAGSSEDRGDIVLNWDVGNGVQVSNGRKKVIFSINRSNDGLVHSQLPARFHQGAFVPNGTGGWRKL